MISLSAEASNNSDWANFDVVIAAWYRRARESQMTHYLAANRSAHLSRWLGVPSVLLSAAAGTTLFASLQKDDTSSWMRLAAGLVAVVAAALTALQTFLNSDDRAAKHRTAAAAYGAIRREIEQHQVIRPQSREQATSILEGLRKRLDEIAGTAPDVPDRLWKTAQKEIQHTKRPEGFSAAYLKQNARMSAKESKNQDK
ncbi:SLATT domain-containing protein [Dactylosporangium sp. CA-233914]|uniref:SLATT domain-containing protein n=1 Tax=Dactylosporangium sp. CA-233914 TaxID=3239934 RepID=UPI003D8D9111